MLKMVSVNAENVDASFNLNGDLPSFESKKTDIFGSLDALERSYQTKLDQRNVEDEGDEGDEDKNYQQCDKNVDDKAEERFRKPSVPRGRHSERRDCDEGKYPVKSWSKGGVGSRSGHRPDYKLNPERWKKYSLADTSTCGNRQNSNVAFGLINELRKRKEEGGLLKIESSDGTDSEKILFAQPESKQDTSCSDKSGQPMTYGNVNRMQEYDFSSKVEKRKSKFPVKSNPVCGSSVVGSPSLEHIQDKSDEYTDISDPSQDDGAETVIKAPATSGDGRVCESTDKDDSVHPTSFKKRKGKRSLRNRDQDED